MMESDRVMEWLYGRNTHGIMPGLANITELLDMLGNPQNGLRYIHVAGTDGKGSTCACLESILRASGLKTGLYTSPHLVSFNERIRIGNREISDDDIRRLTERIMPFVKKMDSGGKHCTFFEVTTAMAFLYFSENKPDWVIIEVGLGGRFDATNVITPEMTIITNLSMEHMDYLGDTIEKIAFEKAGIVKKGVPCVTCNHGSALGVIENVCKDNGARVHAVDNINVTGSRPDGIDFSFAEKEYEVSVPGRHQAINASMALKALALLKIPEVSEDSIRSGLSNVKWPCRMEKIKDLPIIIDVTHTRAGSADLASDISELYGKVTVVFGVLGDKDIEHIAENISKISVRVIVALPRSPRAAPGALTAEIVGRYSKETLLADSVSGAMDLAMNLRKEEMILVTGSFHMAEEAEEWLKKICARR